MFVVFILVVFTLRTQPRHITQMANLSMTVMMKTRGNEEKIVHHTIQIQLYSASPSLNTKL